MNHFAFILLSGLLKAGDKNITNCLAGARGTVETLRKSLLATTGIKADHSPERQHAVLREWLAGASKFSDGAQPGASCFNGNLLSCGKWRSHPYCFGGELCLLISLYFKVLQQLGSFTVELRKFSFHLLPDNIKMKETMLTGAKSKMEEIGGGRGS